MTLNYLKIFLNFIENFIKSYNEESNKGYFHEADIQYPEKLHNFYNDLPILTRRMKTEKVKKLLVNLRNKSEYVIHIIKNQNKLKSLISFKKSLLSH